jgi:hypothetical protein
MGGIDVKSLFVKEVTTLKKKRKEHFILWGEGGGGYNSSSSDWPVSDIDRAMTLAFGPQSSLSLSFFLKFI